jgi:hypothetical protein
MHLKTVDYPGRRVQIKANLYVVSSILLNSASLAASVNEPIEVTLKLLGGRS